MSLKTWNFVIVESTSDILHDEQTSSVKKTLCDTQLNHVKINLFPLGGETDHAGRLALRGWTKSNNGLSHLTYKIWRWHILLLSILQFAQLIK